jgi:hypothetical protein
VSHARRTGIDVRGSRRTSGRARRR